MSATVARKSNSSRNRTDLPFSIQDTQGSRNCCNSLKTKHRGHFYSRQKHADFAACVGAPRGFATTVSSRNVADTQLQGLVVSGLDPERPVRKLSSVPAGEWA
jgi:hypothetical protein